MMSLTGTVAIHPDLVHAIIEDGSLPMHLQQELKASIQVLSLANDVGMTANVSSFNRLDSACVAMVRSFMSPSCILAFRTGSKGALRWAMQRALVEPASVQKVHNLVRDSLSHRNVLRHFEQVQQRLEQTQQRQLRTETRLEQQETRLQQHEMRVQQLRDELL